MTVMKRSGQSKHHCPFRPTAIPRGGTSWPIRPTCRRARIKTLHYFGQEMICFRGESGTVAVINAYCQHLGGHIGVGGTVVGDEVKCPWHAWQWRADGTNSLIPYSKEGCKKSVRIRTYPVVEWCDMVLMWFDRDGGEPDVEPARRPRARDGRLLPAPPALPHAQPGQGPPADDRGERGGPVPHRPGPPRRPAGRDDLVRAPRLLPPRHGRRELRRRAPDHVADAERPGRR